MHESTVFCSACTMSSVRKFTFASSSPDEFPVLRPRDSEQMRRPPAGQKRRAFSSDDGHKGWGIAIVCTWQTLITVSASVVSARSPCFSTLHGNRYA